MKDRQFPYKERPDEEKFELDYFEAGFDTVKNQDCWGGFKDINNDKLGGGPQYANIDWVENMQRLVAIYEKKISQAEDPAKAREVVDKLIAYIEEVTDQKKTRKELFSTFTNNKWEL